MMRERDIRQETFEEYKDSKQSKLVTFSAYISSKGTTEVYQYYPETNEWSYYLDEFGVTRTKDWRYDSQCSEPLELQYDFSFAFGARPNEVNTPRLLIPESYRDRLDEFIKDKDDTDKTLP